MTTRPKAEVPVVHRVPAHLARLFHQICLGALAEITGPEDLSPLQYGIIGSIQDQPGIDQRRLAERMGIDTVSAHHHIEFLEKRGLVARTTDPNDRRSRVLKLTPRGLRLRRQLRPGIIDAHDRVLSPLSKSERTVFLDLLTRVVESNETYARPGNGRRRPPKRITELMR
jgi:DNA-binding MarR family transcriptional regulator